MLIVVIVIGLLYALPNLFGEDPAVQITGGDSARTSDLNSRILTKQVGKRIQQTDDNHHDQHDVLPQRITV